MHKNKLHYFQACLYVREQQSLKYQLSIGVQTYNWPLEGYVKDLLISTLLTPLN